MHAPARPAHSAITAKRIALFAGFLTALLAGGAATALSAWSRFGSGAEWVLWVLLLPAFLFAPAILLSRRTEAGAGPGVKLVYQIAAASLGLLSYLFLAGALTWLFGGVAEALGSEKAAHAFALLFFALGAGATLFGLGNALFGLQVTQRDVFLKNLPESWNGRTVALVTDLHFGNIYGPRFSRRVVARLRYFSPDLVLVGGDLFDGNEGNFDAALEPWKLLAPQFGVHYVTGNHEEFGDRESFLVQVRRAGIRELKNTKVELDGLQLLGVHDAEAGEPETFRAFLKEADIDKKRPAVLLAHIPHQPNFLPAEKAGVSLYLSGHTHDGQVWPWNLLANRVHGAFVYGLHPFSTGAGTLQVCTSSGAGSWGPPLRVGTRSEIVLLRLRPAV